MARGTRRTSGTLALKARRPGAGFGAVHAVTISVATPLLRCESHPEGTQMEPPWGPMGRPLEDDVQTKRAWFVMSPTFVHARAKTKVVTVSTQRCEKAILGTSELAIATGVGLGNSSHQAAPFQPSQLQCPWLGYRIFVSEWCLILGNQSQSPWQQAPDLPTIGRSRSLLRSVASKKARKFPSRGLAIKIEISNNVNALFRDYNIDKRILMDKKIEHAVRRLL